MLFRNNLFGLKIHSYINSGWIIALIQLLLLYTVSCQVFPSDSAGGISCFQCHSVNYSDPACHDPFNSSLYPQMTGICSQGRRDQRGIYPGRFCFKIKGTRASDGVEVVVRRCSVDPLVDNTLKSHFGHFKIITDGQPQQFYGTVSMCRFDGCNSASELRGNERQSSLLMASVSLLVAVCGSWAV